MIEIDGLYKRYGLPLTYALKKIAARIKNKGDEFEEKSWALRDVSLKVERGETLGLIGENGAGKSTLLKVLAGVSPPTRGGVEIRGRMFPMIQLNTGMHMELSGRENSFLLGSIMGFTRKEMKSRIGAIEDFCELGDWFDRPVRMYSSGMLARLGFAVAVNVRAEILLIDEVLAVGDLHFQKKCFDHMERLRRDDVTVLFVSHNIRQVQRICDRVAWFGGGYMLRAGDVEKITGEYYETYMGKHNAGERTIKRRYIGTDEIKVESVRVFGRDANAVISGKNLFVEIEFAALEDIDGMIPGISFRTTDFIRLFSVKTDILSLKKGKYCLRWELPRLQLAPGSHIITLVFKAKNNRLICRIDNVETFVVFPMENKCDYDGLFWLDAKWSVDNLENRTTMRSGEWRQD